MYNFLTPSDEGQYGKGQRTRMEDASGSTSWQYDEKGRATQESKIIDHNGTPLTFTTQWSYDAADRIHTMTYPADEEGNLGETITYQYSQDESQTRAQVEGLVSDLGTYVSGMEYNVYGQLTEATLATGTTPSQHVTQRFTYYALDDLHGLGRLREMQSYKSAQPLLQRLTYSYDGVGNVLSIQNELSGETQSEQFSYDHLDRLMTAQAADGNNGLYSTDYTYDDIGNLTSKGGTSYTYGTQASYCTAGALEKPHAVTSQGAWEYCYDANGNMTSKAVPSILATTYSYDDENRLTEVTDNNGTPIAKYTYDGDGNRVKVADTQTTFYVGNHIEWRNGTLTKYYYIGSTRVAMREGDTLSFILANQLGSATVTLDSSGSVQSELRYHPFGETRHSSGTTPTTRRFTGQIQDEGTGLYYYNARYYDPAIGRFIQADTIVPEPGNPQALNRYSYVYNNPLKYTDPTGHCTEAPDNDACWQAYSEARSKLRPGFDFISQWDTAELEQLIAWLDRGMVFDGQWSSTGLHQAIQSLDYTLNAIGDWNTMAPLLGLSNPGAWFTISISPGFGSHRNASGAAAPWINLMLFDNAEPGLLGFLHELGHIIDYNLAQNLGSDSDFWSETGLIGIGWNKTSDPNQGLLKSRPSPFRYDRASNQAPYSTMTPVEDFADTFTAWTLAKNGLRDPQYNLTPKRDHALTTAINQVR